VAGAETLTAPGEGRRLTASRVDQLYPTGIRAMMALAAERSRRGLPVLRMEAGQSSFPTPPPVIEAAFPAARDGFTDYTPNAGIPSLRAAVAERVAARNGVEVGPGTSV